MTEEESKQQAAEERIDTISKQVCKEEADAGQYAEPTMATPASSRWGGWGKSSAVTTKSLAELRKREKKERRREKKDSTRSFDRPGLSGQGRDAPCVWV